MKAESRLRTIGGIQFEAVRLQIPCPHWRVKVIETGEVYEPGVFRGMGSLVVLWQSVEDTARRRGNLWRWDNALEAHPKYGTPPRTIAA